MSCFVCLAVARKAVNLFGDDNTMKKKVNEVLSEILDKKIKPGNTHSDVLCRRCYNKVSDYHVSKVLLLEDFKKTLSVKNLNYDSYGSNDSSPKTVPKKIVLPASKLQPLPADFLLDVGKLAAVTALSNVGTKSQDSVKMLASPVKPMINLRVTVGSSVLSQNFKSTITTSQPKTTQSHTLLKPHPKPDDDCDHILSSLVNLETKKNNAVLSFNQGSLPKDFLATPSIKSENKFIENEMKIECDLKNDDEMEIDEGCSVAEAVDEESDNEKLIFEIDPMKDKSIDLKPKSIFFDLNMLLEGNSESRESDKDKYILDKLGILNGNDVEDEEDTIVVENGGKTTIIRMPAGQRVVYDGKEISVLPDDGDQQDNGRWDSHDSNDDSQIELQMSGDEETANAIIAAAQKSGGAFIKVDSGEMFRVESVKSRTEEDINIPNMVERDGNLFKCLLCNKSSGTECVADADTIMSHLRSIHGARAYVCPICGTVMRKRADYTKHLELHAGKGAKTKPVPPPRQREKHSCDHCGKTFATKYSHQHHLKTHSVRPRPYACHDCGKTFLTPLNLTHHEKTHSGIKEFVCPVCNKAFATQHNLEVHSVVHSGRKPFSCNICQKSFARKPEVRNHMRIHTGERPYACDICGATFSQQSNLNSHKRATHFDDKRHHCTECPKKFKRRRLLDYHIKAAHTGERPLQCSVCPATFVYPEHYKKHARIHSGEKPYACEVCGKCFSSRENRNWHRFVHSDKKPYECLACGMGYMRKQLLYAHMNTTGHVAESIVVNQPRVVKSTDEILESANENIVVATNNTVASSISVVQEPEDSAFLTLHNLNNFIETADDKLVDQAQVLISDDKDGSMVRLIQVHLPDGNTGWVAIENTEAQE